MNHKWTDGWTPAGDLEIFVCEVCGMQSIEVTETECPGIRVVDNKSEPMQKALDNLAEGLFGMKKTDAVYGKNCVACKKQAVNFRDSISIREYQISGLCQECQDKVFEADEE
jgi:hypothetical protein